MVTINPRFAVGGLPLSTKNPRTGSTFAVASEPSEGTATTYAERVERLRFNEFDELEGLGLAGGVAVDLATELNE